MAASRFIIRSSKSEAKVHVFEISAGYVTRWGTLPGRC